MIVLPKNTKTWSGQYGTYFRIGKKRGLKVLRGTFRSIQSAYNSATFDLAKEEASLLEMAYESGVAPKCFGVRIAKRGSVFRVGILMQHLGNKTLADLNLDEDKESKIHDRLKLELEVVGLDHCDLHNRNIMFYKSKFYAVDFSPECVDMPTNN